MKKIIYSLSILMAGGLAANAVTIDRSMIQKEAVNVPQTEAQLPTTVSEGEAYKGIELTRVGTTKRRAIENVQASDFAGVYEWKGYDLLDGQAGHPTSGSLYIEQDAKDPNQFTISNFCIFGTLVATFNPSTGHLEIPDQFVSRVADSSAEVWFRNYSVRNGVSSSTGEQVHVVIPNPDSPFYFSMHEDGVIRAGDLDPVKWEDFTYTDAELLEYCCIATCGRSDVQNSYYWAERGISAAPIKPFEFVDDEWTYLGFEEYSDPWFFMYGFGTWEVDLYENNADHNTILIMNPYGPGTPFKQEVQWGDGSVGPLNVSNEDGYVIINVGDPNCVVVKTLVPALTENAAASTDGLSQTYYLTNREGASYYTNGNAKEDIMVSLDAEGLNVSYLNTRTNQVFIYNPRFTYPVDPLSLLSFGAYTRDSYGYVFLPEEWKWVPNAVESIVDEAVEGPEVYYNLQGVRLANPEKGQIVIVKKGNKTWKQIYR